MLRRWLVLLAVGGFAAAACSGASGDTGPTAEVTAPPRESTTTTEARTPEEEVEAAYLRSWEVYAKAVRELDPSGLEESYAGEALETVRAEIARLASAGTPIVVQVEHEVGLQLISETDALVRDRYVNRNYRVDGSGRPIDDPDDPGTYVESYQMKRVDDRWRVVRIVRESHQP
jgi:hypothetical protein